MSTLTLVLLDVSAIRFIFARLSVAKETDSPWMIFIPPATVEADQKSAYTFVAQST